MVMFFFNCKALFKNLITLLRNTGNQYLLFLTFVFIFLWLSIWILRKTKHRCLKYGAFFPFALTDLPPHRSDLFPLECSVANIPTAAVPVGWWGCGGAGGGVAEQCHAPAPPRLVPAGRPAPPGPATHPHTCSSQHHLQDTGTRTGTSVNKGNIGFDSVMWIRIGWNADPDPWSALASVWIRINMRTRIRGVKCYLKVNEEI